MLSLLAPRCCESAPQSIDRDRPDDNEETVQLEWQEDAGALAGGVITNPAWTHGEIASHFSRRQQALARSALEVSRALRSQETGFLDSGCKAVGPVWEIWLGRLGLGLVWCRRRNGRIREVLSEPRDVLLGG